MKNNKYAILTLIGIILVVLGIFLLSASQYDGNLKSKMEQAESYGQWGVILLVVGGVGIVAGYVLNDKDIKDAVREDNESLNRYELRLKEINQSYKNNEISQEDFKVKKENIFKDMNSQIKSQENLKKRINEMELDNIISKEDTEKILGKVDEKVKENNKKSKRKKIIIIVVIIIICLYVVSARITYNNTYNAIQSQLSK